MNEENSSPDPDQRLTISVGKIFLTADRHAVILRLGERELLIWYSDRSRRVAFPSCDVSSRRNRHRDTTRTSWRKSIESDRVTFADRPCLVSIALFDLRLVHMDIREHL